MPIRLWFQDIRHLFVIITLLLLSGFTTIVSAQSSDAETYRLHLTAARDHLNAGRHEQAAKSAATAIQLAPHAFEAYVIGAAALSEQDRFDDAEQLLLLAIKRAPPAKVPAIEQILTDMRERRAATAQPVDKNKALQVASSALQRARLAAERGDAVEVRQNALIASNVLQPLIRSQAKDDVRAWTLAGYAAATLEDLELATQSYEAVSRLRPDYATDPTLSGLMKSLTALGVADRAMTLRSTRANPDPVPFDVSRLMSLPMLACFAVACLLIAILLRVLRAKPASPLDGQTSAVPGTMLGIATLVVWVAGMTLWSLSNRSDPDGDPSYNTRWLFAIFGSLGLGAISCAHAARGRRNGLLSASVLICTLILSVLMYDTVLMLLDMGPDGAFGAVHPFATQSLPIKEIKTPIWCFLLAGIVVAGSFLLTVAMVRRACGWIAAMVYAVLINVAPLAGIFAISASGLNREPGSGLGAIITVLKGLSPAALLHSCWNPFSEIGAFDPVPGIVATLVLTLISGVLPRRAVLPAVPSSSAATPPAFSPPTPLRAPPPVPSAFAAPPVLSARDALEWRTIGSVYDELVAARSDPARAVELQSIAEELMNRSSRFCNPGGPADLWLWRVRAEAALQLNRAPDGRRAAEMLGYLGAMTSSDPQIGAVLIRLNRAGWLDQ